MSESLERRLGIIDILKVRLHLLVCAWCAQYLKQIKFMRRLARKEAFTAAINNAAPVALTAEARQRIAESLRRRNSV